MRYLDFAKKSIKHRENGTPKMWKFQIFRTSMSPDQQEERVFVGAFGVHLLLSITRKYTIINANLEVINAKIHSFYLVDIYYRRYASICTKGQSIAATDEH